MPGHLEGIEDWFLERPNWLQDAARRILQNGTVAADDLAQLTALCKAEAGITDAARGPLAPVRITRGSIHGSQSAVALRLNSISDLKGINALAPRKPLELADNLLTIVFGQNATGKSGYVRALKHASGVRKPGPLYRNVFTNQPVEQGCKFKFTIDGLAKEVSWIRTGGPLDELKSIQIYDSERADLYINEENEVAFEPFILSLFTQLTEVCARVNSRLENEIRSKNSNRPGLPLEFLATRSAAWYGSLTPETTNEEIFTKCQWTGEMEAELAELNKRLAETNPSETASNIRRQQQRVSRLIEDLAQWRQKLSDETCDSYFAARQNARSRRRAADTDARAVFANAPLEGVGSESWKLLWQQARAYSEGMAYPGFPFPNTTGDARCVLCQQSLDQDARLRLASFESFVTGGLETEAVAAEAQQKAFLDDLAGIPDTQLDLRLDSVGLTDTAKRQPIDSYCHALQNRRNSLPTAENVGQLPSLPSESLLNYLQELSQTLQEQALALDQDAQGENRPELIRRHKELGTRKWLSQQRTSIEAEIARLKEIRDLEEARRLTNTQPLSLKKSLLADELITAAYIDRFQKQLDSLGACHIKVDLVKTRAERGHVFHQMRLKRATQSVPTSEILSEGEFRIASLALFLADVEARQDNSVFVFDDPISSLDQTFEEATVAKLIDLSKTRQVIVFTHRLSLMSQMEEIAKKENIATGIISLRTEQWGIGEPGDTPLHAKKPDRALNDLLMERLPKARQALQRSTEDYEILAKGICSDFRIIIERLIENDLLADVVQRFRRGVQTKDKIMKLAKIKVADCRLFDDLMTKYSRFEHSQPQEAPIPLPPADELEQDFRRVKEWLQEFRGRAVS